MTPQPDPDPFVFLAVLTIWFVIIGGIVGACYLLSQWYWRRHPIAPPHSEKLGTDCPCPICVEMAEVHHAAMRGEEVDACWKCGELLEHHCSECGTGSCPECGPVWS
jgi:hypothetical protein